MGSYVVDVQGFKAGKREFIFKEVAVVALEKDSTPSVYLFKPPFAFNELPRWSKAENIWLERNFHGLTWPQGFIPYADLDDTLSEALQNAREVYVKGREKVSYLKKYASNIKDLEDIGCPSLKDLRKPSSFTMCSLHNRNIWLPACAAWSVHVLKNWLLDQRRNPTVCGYNDDDGVDEVDRMDIFDIEMPANVKEKLYMMYN